MRISDWSSDVCSSDLRTADAIWRLRDDGLAPDEIAALLADAHGIAPHAAKADVARIVDQWRTAGLIGADPPPPGPDAPIPVLPDSDTPIRTADYVIEDRKSTRLNSSH